MVAIRFQNVAKSYRLARQRPFLAKEILRRILARPAQIDTFWALQDVSFEVKKGDTLGVIGANGSGKSTLLSLVAHTSYPTRGEVMVEGRIGPLLELGAGFHPDLTGLENVYLNASLLGMRKEEVDEKIASIAEYSGIREFMDASIQTYSTGMLARLGFAVLAHMEPDILLVDEAMSVGDAEFQAKCQKTIEQFLTNGTTVMLVSHDLDTVASICRQVLWIDKGRVHAHGPADEVITKYCEFIAAGLPAPQTTA